MDAYVEEILEADVSAPLSYDEGISYEEQVAALPPELPRNETPALAGRISMNKVYLPPESMLKGKRKRGDEADEADETMEEDEEMEGASDGLRRNALYIRGPPITHLPTNNIFAYARHFNLEPVGLEWVDDSSCVLIFPSNVACRTAFEVLRKSSSEEPDFDDCVTAKPVPVVIWPMEDRINKTLGKTDEMEGTLLIRIARTSDKKSRGAKYRSGFYQKHGMDAGKDPNAHAIGRALENGTNRGRSGLGDDEEKRRQLDEELDNFLQEGDERTPSPPPSKMRSDYIPDDGREIRRLPKGSLLERTSLSRSPFDDEGLPGRIRTRRRGGRRVRGQEQKSLGERISGFPPTRRRKHEDGETHVGRYEPPKKTREELDAELEAFLDGNN